MPLERRTATPRRVLFTTLLGVASSSFAVTVLSAALPDIGRDLGATDATSAWVVILPMVVFAMGTPILGKVGDLHGHRKVYLWGFGAFAVLTLATAAAWNIGALIAFRTLAQLTGAATGPAALALIMSVYPPEERTRPLSTWAAVIAASPALGVAVGGWLIEFFGWRLIFVLQAVPAVIAVLVAIPVLPETRTRQGVRFDVAGAATLAPAVALLLVGVNRAPVWGLGHPLVLAALAGAVACAVAFVLIERAVAAPLLPLEVFTRRGFVVPLGAQVTMQSSYMGALVVTPFLLANGWGFDTGLISLILLSRPLTFSVASKLAGAAAGRISERDIIVTGTGAVAVAAVMMAIGAQYRLLWVIVVAVCVSGFGNGFSRPPIVASVGNSVDEEDLGIATGTFNMFGQVGATLGIAAMTALPGVGGDLTASDYTPAFVLAAAIGVWSPILGSRISVRHRVTTGPGGGGTLGPTSQEADDAQETRSR